jgi:hypothetical protein
MRVATAVGMAFLVVMVAITLCSVFLTVRWLVPRDGPPERVGAAVCAAHRSSSMPRRSCPVTG